MKNVYTKFQDKQEDMTLMDYLSIDRTTLSIERTHLAYMRTVVSMIVAGITLFKILNGVEGYICAAILFLSAVYFYVRGRKICRNISKNLHVLEDEDD